MRVWEDSVSVYVKHGQDTVRPMVHPNSTHGAKFGGENNIYRDHVSSTYGARICHDGASVFKNGDHVIKKHFAQTTRFEIQGMNGRKGEKEIWFIDYHENGDHVPYVFVRDVEAARLNWKRVLRGGK